MKSVLWLVQKRVILSHPPRGEWIEMLFIAILKNSLPRLTPRGVSGLKWIDRKISLPPPVSHPPRGEWIEITSGPWR